MMQHNNWTVLNVISILEIFVAFHTHKKIKST